MRGMRNGSRGELVFRRLAARSDFGSVVARVSYRLGASRAAAAWIPFRLSGSG